jgi:hypothetical protein
VSGVPFAPPPFTAVSIAAVDIVCVGKRISCVPASALLCINSETQTALNNAALFPVGKNNLGRSPSWCAVGRTKLKPEAYRTTIHRAMNS